MDDDLETIKSPFMLNLRYEWDYKGRAGEMPTCFNIFGNPTAIAKAAGLDIELPDVDNTDPAYWAELHRLGWKKHLDGRIVSPWHEGDPDYAFLMRINDAAEVWFDIEEGIKVMSRGKYTPIVLDWIADLARKGIPMTFPDDNQPCVWAQIRMHGSIDAAEVFSQYGLISDHRDICFVPTPEWIKSVKKTS